MLEFNSNALQTEKEKCFIFANSHKQKSFMSRVLHPVTFTRRYYSVPIRNTQIRFHNFYSHNEFREIIVIYMINWLNI